MGPAVLTQCQEPPILRQMFVMDLTGFDPEGEKGAAIMTDESVCLDAPMKDDTSNVILRVKVIACTGHARQSWSYNSQVFSIFV